MRLFFTIILSSVISTNCVSTSQAEKAQTQPSVAPARLHSAPGAIVNGLRFEAEVSPQTIVSGKDLNVSVAVVNDSRDPVRFFRPKHFDLEGVVNWSLVRSDGKIFVPTWHPYGSAQTHGMDGDIMKIPAGTKSILMKARVRSVHSVEKDQNLKDLRNLFSTRQSFHIPPGEYRIAFSFEKSDNFVPYIDRDIRQERIEGLWTGTIMSNEQKVHVTPKTEPFIELSGPRRIPWGQPCPFRIKVENPTAEHLKLNGAFILTMRNKPGTSARLRFKTSPEVAVMDRDETFTFDLPAHEMITFEMDLTEFPLELIQQWNAQIGKSESGNGRIVHLREVPGLPGSCGVSFVDEEGNIKLHPAGIIIDQTHFPKASQPTPNKTITTRPG